MGAQINPSVSVILAVYNAEEFLLECIESILNQTCPDFEFIIVNDGSTDNSLSIIKQCAEKDSRIQYISNATNSERSFSRNRAIALARAEYIAVMDADDVSVPHRLEKQLHYFREHPEIAVLGGAMREYETGKLLPAPCDDLRFRLFFDSVIAHPTVMFKKSVFNKTKGYDLLLPPCEDYGLWIAISDLGYEIANMPDVLTLYRTHPDDPRTSYRQKQRDSLYAIWREQFKKIGVDFSGLDFYLHSFCAHPKRDFPFRHKLGAAWLYRLIKANKSSHYLGSDFEQFCECLKDDFPKPYSLANDTQKYVLSFFIFIFRYLCHRTGRVGHAVEKLGRHFYNKFPI